MANRNASAAYITELANAGIRPFHLLNILFATPLKLTDYIKDLYIFSDFWFANYNLTGIPKIVESTSLTAQTIRVSLNGVNPSNISTMLLTTNTHRQMKIYRGLVNSSHQVVVDPIVIYNGFIDYAEHDYNASNGTVDLTWTISNYWANFKSKNGRFTNDKFHQGLYSGDKFFNHTSEIIKQIQWGKS